jgi:hypothetical protein
MSGAILDAKALEVKKCGRDLPYRRSSRQAFKSIAHEMIIPSRGDDLNTRWA